MQPQIDVELDALQPLVAEGERCAVHMDSIQLGASVAPSSVRRFTDPALQWPP